jgi:hypothetical protein
VSESELCRIAVVAHTRACSSDARACGSRSTARSPR